MYARSFGCPPRGMGLLPAVPVAVATGGTVLKALSTVGASIPILGGIFQSSDPEADRRRVTRIDTTFNAAMAGDPSAISCLSDMAKGISSGPTDPRQCAVGSTLAAAYAKARWIEYQGRVAAGTVGTGLLKTGGVLVGESNIPSQIGATISRVMTNPLLLGGLAVGVYLLLRPKGRRAA